MSSIGSTDKNTNVEVFCMLYVPDTVWNPDKEIILWNINAPSFIIYWEILFDPSQNKNMEGE